MTGVQTCALPISACVAYQIGDAVFVGDTLFMPDVGTARCDFPGGDAKTLYASVKKILSLPEDTRLFMCHDYPPTDRAVAFETTVGEQRRKNIHVHDGISEAELQRVKAQWVAQAVYKRDSLFNQAREIGTYWVEGLPLDTSDRLIDLLRGVTAEQVKSVAQRYFGDDSLTVAHLLPQPSNAQAPRKPAMPLRHGEGTR